MTHKDKALAIIRRIRDLANQDVRITFGDDWGGNRLTVFLDGPDGSTHHHTGTSGDTENDLVDQLHGILTNPSICEEVIKN